MCPFLKKTSPATLRSLSSSVNVQHAAPGGGAMSNLQIIARRCPVMGKALSVQSGRNIASSALAGAFNGTRAYHKVPRAKLHTTTPKEAQAVDLPNLDRDHVPFKPPMAKADGNASTQHQHGVAPDPPEAAKYDYAAFYENELDKKHKDKSY
ncbi:hypothetical protein LTR53_019539, partial [Teratosphaeriaceae sp. CCFEE 6253]